MPAHRPADRSAPPFPRALRARAPLSAPAPEHKDRLREYAVRKLRRARSPTSSPRPATIRAFGRGAASPAPTYERAACSPLWLSSRAGSLPRHRREIVDEDRRVLPQTLKLRVGDGLLPQLEDEGVDAVLGQLLLRFPQGRVVGVKTRRRRHLVVDRLERGAVILEVIVGIGVDADVERLDVADDRQIIVLVFVDAAQPLRPFYILNLGVDPNVGELSGDDLAALTRVRRRRQDEAELERRRDARFLQ